MCVSNHSHVLSHLYFIQYYDCQIKLYIILLCYTFHIIYLPVSQLVPVYPGLHVHLYLLMRLLQIPPFLQGLLTHSLISEVKYIDKYNYVIIYDIKYGIQGA